MNTKVHEVEQYEYTVSNPISEVFDQLDDVQMIARAAHSPKSDQQLINIFITIIQNTNDFQRALED